MFLVLLEWINAVVAEKQANIELSNAVRAVRKRRLLCKLQEQCDATRTAEFKNLLLEHQLNTLVVQDIFQSWHSLVRRNHGLRLKLFQLLIDLRQKQQHSALRALQTHVRCARGRDKIWYRRRHYILISWRGQLQRRYALARIFHGLKLRLKGQAISTWLSYDRWCRRNEQLHILRLHVQAWEWLTRVEKLRRNSRLLRLQRTMKRLRVNLNMRRSIRVLCLVINRFILRTSCLHWDLVVKGAHVRRRRTRRTLLDFVKALSSRRSQCREDIFVAWRSITVQAKEKAAPLRLRSTRRRAFLTWRNITLQGVSMRELLFAQALASAIVRNDSGRQDIQLPIDLAYISTKHQKFGV